MTERYIDPWGYFEMDDATGLPATPDGMFFRVCRGRVLRGYWYVELRRKTWYGSRVVESTPLDWDAETKRDVMSRESIVYNAGYVMWKLRERPEYTHDLSLLGDYPPKTLNPKE